MPRRMLGPEWRAFFIRVWKSLPSRCVLKTLRKSPKRTISASSGFGLLQMVLVQMSGSVPVRMLSPEGGWIVRSHIGWREEQSILYKGVETSP